jgi:hypothetical protein
VIPGQRHGCSRPYKAARDCVAGGGVDLVSLVGERHLTESGCARCAGMDYVFCNAVGWRFDGSALRRVTSGVYGRRGHH